MARITYMSWTSKVPVRVLATDMANGGCMRRPTPHHVVNLNGGSWTGLTWRRPALPRCLLSVPFHHCIEVLSETGHTNLIILSGQMAFCRQRPQFSLFPSTQLQRATNLQPLNVAALR